VTIQVIFLNGGSSSGKSAISAALPEVLPDPWLSFGVDILVAAWMAGLAAMARAGARLIIDEVLLSGGPSQQRWREALDGLGVLWVGVRCDGPVAAAREAARGDRITGMALSQATAVHRGMAYDLEVDTTGTGSLECARVIAARIG
jgi:chloramphenicol 3-O phosphotransferase